MAKTFPFKALSQGTMSNPYRFIEKDQVVHLTEEEAAFYKKSRWLRPKAEVDAMKPQPLMPHLKITGSDGSQGRVMQMPPYALPPSPMTQNYQDQMDAIGKKEAIEDGVLGATGEEAATGTGNQDPLA